MKKTMSLLLAGAMMTAALSGCGGGTQPPADTGTNTADGGADTTATAFKIGGTGPLTGGAAIYGNAVYNGAKIAVTEINAMGGIQFDLKYEDDENDAEKAFNAYNALKDWGVQLSLGAVTTKPGEATAPDHFADRIFALTPSASSMAVIEGKDNVYQMCFTDPDQGSASAKYIASKQLGTKIAVIYQNDSVYSQGIYDSFKAEAEALGLKVVSASTFVENANDFSVQLGQAKDAGADLLFLPIYYTPASLVLTQAKSMGYAPKVFGVDGMDGILSVENFDTTLAEGVMLLTPFNADAEDANVKSFVGKYKELFKDTPNQFAADAYDCIYAYKQALEAAGCTADMSASELCERLVAAFPTISFTGITGENMTWTNGAVSREPKGMVIENGAYVGMD